MARAEDCTDRHAAPATTGDESIATTPEGDPAAGLEGLLRMDVGTLEEMLPQILDAVARGPLVMTRHGREFAVLLPLDAYRRLWTRAEPGDAPASMPVVRIIEGKATPSTE
jgi:prevent-host-death family protein